MDRKKWQHDKFDEKFQAPKSRQEIVAVYGFDIREDCLPLEITKKSNKHRFELCALLIARFCKFILFIIYIMILYSLIAILVTLFTLVLIS